MKKSVLLAVLWIFAAVSVCLAGTINFSWDSEPAPGVGQSLWQAVRIYECPGTASSYACGPVPVVTASQTSPFNYSSFPTSVSLLNVSAGSHNYIARGWDGTNESADSNFVTTVIGVLPATPTNLKFNASAH
jgi:hypothetical protein